jgi:histidinol-phosphate aminotransferase
MLSPRRDIEKMALQVHGGIDYAELRRLGISPEDVIDFSVSVNPFGPPPGIEAAISGAAIDRYPDSESGEVREALGKKLGLRPDQIVIGSGSTEIIRLIAAAFFGPEELVVIPQPTYGEYEVACRIAGAQLLKPSMSREPGLRLNISRVKALVDRRHPHGLFICNPNNPTGEYLAKDSLQLLLDAAPDCLVVVDEAYVAFTDDAWDSTEFIETGHLIIVRSMTKDFALPGLRLGYALASKKIVSLLDRVKPPWNVSSVAQAAATFVIENDAYLKACSKRLRESGEFLVNGLVSRGLKPLPSKANFFLVNVGDAAGLKRALLLKGIIVRDCASFGLPAYVRMAPRTIGECERLLTAMDDPEVRRHVG